MNQKLKMLLVLLALFNCCYATIQTQSTIEYIGVHQKIRLRCTSDVPTSKIIWERINISDNSFQLQYIRGDEYEIKDDPRITITREGNDNIAISTLEIRNILWNDSLLYICREQFGMIRFVNPTHIYNASDELNSVGAVKKLVIWDTTRNCVMNLSRVNGDVIYCNITYVSHDEELFTTWKVGNVRYPLSERIMPSTEKVYSLGNYTKMIQTTLNTVRGSDWRTGNVILYLCNSGFTYNYQYMVW